MASNDPLPHLCPFCSISATESEIRVTCPVSGEAGGTPTIAETYSERLLVSANRDDEFGDGLRARAVCHTLTGRIRALMSVGRWRSSIAAFTRWVTSSALPAS